MLLGRMRYVFGWLFIALALIAPASTTAAFRPESALERIQVPWQKLGYKIVFMPPKPGFRAMTFPKQRKIEVYARPGDDLELLMFDIAHEIGHVIDLTHNTLKSRQEWMKVRGIDPKTQWFGCNRCSDYKTPAGDFAESFAVFLCGPKYFRGLIASVPPPEQIEALTRFFPKDFLPVVAD